MKKMMTLMKFIEEKYRIVEFASIFSFWKHFLEFFAGINFRGFELANIFVGSNFRDFAEKPQKTRKLVPAKISSFKVNLKIKSLVFKNDKVLNLIAIKERDHKANDFICGTMILT